MRKYFYPVKKKKESLLILINASGKNHMVRFSLIPREERFFDLLDEHAVRILEGVKLFQSMLLDWSLDHISITRLKNLEHEADMTTHEIINMLNRTFVTPIDREDIHLLAKQLDDVLDITFKVAVRLQLFRVRKITAELISLTEVLKEAAEVVVKAIESIRHLDRPQRVLDYCIDINRLENQGDLLSEQAILNLFQNPTEPLEVIKWKELYDSIEDGIDKCEDIANTLEGVVVKYG